jgi:hypothetical protein
MIDLIRCFFFSFPYCKFPLLQRGRFLRYFSRLQLIGQSKKCPCTRRSNDNNARLCQDTLKTNWQICGRLRIWGKRLVFLGKAPNRIITPDFIRSFKSDQTFSKVWGPKKSSSQTKWKYLALINDTNKIVTILTDSYSLELRSHSISKARSCCGDDDIERFYWAGDSGEPTIRSIIVALDCCWPPACCTQFLNGRVIMIIF